MGGFLEIRLTGGADNADPNASLGGVMSANEVALTINNLFRDITKSELDAGIILHRAIDVYNSGDAACKVVSAFVVPTTSPGTQVDFGLDATAQEIVDEETVPADVVFDHYEAGTALPINDIAAGAAQRIWCRLIVTAGCSPLADDGGSIEIPYAPAEA